MSELQLVQTHKYVLEVGHSKSGKDHVLIIKSLRVSDDDLTEALLSLKAALNAFREMDLS
jgi:hypothetical protein